MWRALGASVRGTSHIHVGLPCQDAHAYRTLAGDCLLAAVADGLGSAAHSDVGSKLAVQAALDSLEQNLSAESPSEFEQWNALLVEAFSVAAKKLLETARETETPVREYGTTLILTVMQKGWTAVGHLGDGAVVTVSDANMLETISVPQRGEYANEVTPLTASGALDVVRITIRQSEVIAAAILTDGLQNLCIKNQTSEPHPQFFMPFFEALKRPLDIEETSQKLAEFLDTDRVCAKTDDDKTLVFLWKDQIESGMEF